MTFTEAAAEVLRLMGKPLHYKDITEIAIQKNLLSHVGKSPEVTMGSRLAALLKKSPKENPLVRMKPGVFALRAWEDGGPPGPASEAEAPAAPEAKRSGATAAAHTIEEETVSRDELAFRDELAARDEPAAATTDDEPLLPSSDAVDAPAEASPVATREHAKPLPHAARMPPPRERREPREHARTPQSADEAMRADLAASAADMFGEEDDDDKPILGDDSPTDAAATRRRRRRRRGGRDEGRPVESTEPALPGYTVSPAFGDAAPKPDAPRAEPRRDRDRDREPRREDRAPRGAAPVVDPLVGYAEGEEPVGRDLADTIVMLLTGFDRGAGPVPLRALTEAGQRRARLSGEPAVVQSQIAAAVRADSLRRSAAGQRVRFRFSGGRVSLTDWQLGPELLRLEADALSAIERYREGARRALARKLSELPPHAFVEVCITLLERLGVSQLRAIRRPGMNGSELHMTGMAHGPAGADTRVAICVRRDGREIGRERVIEMRGSLHHYSGATSGWLFTAGQVLSGAREEAAIVGTAPVVMLDGAGVARACEENDVAVVRASLPLAMPDFDFLDAIRGT